MLTAVDLFDSGNQGIYAVLSHVGVWEWTRLSIVVAARGQGTVLLGRPSGFARSFRKAQDR
jgi:hypothetical protein